MGCNGETVPSSGVGRRQALQEEEQSSVETVVVHADAGDLLPNKAERGLGQWLCNVLVIQAQGLVSYPRHPCKMPGVAAHGAHM